MLSEMKEIRSQLEKFKEQASLGEARSFLTSAKEVKSLKLVTAQRDGMDPNVSGRFVQPKYCSGGIQAEKCVILDLTDETHGNAQGIGLAEVTTRRLFNKMKLEMTYPTGVTNTFLHLMKIPMIMDNDREAMQLALMCCPEAEDHDHMKMIRIPNTAHIGVIEISEGMLPLVENNPNFEVLTEPYDLPFDENGNLF